MDSVPEIIKAGDTAYGKRQFAAWLGRYAVRLAAVEEAFGRDYEDPDRADAAAALRTITEGIGGQPGVLRCQNQAEVGFAHAHLLRFIGLHAPTDSDTMPP